MPTIQRKIHVDVDMEPPSGPISVYRSGPDVSSARLRRDLERRWERWRNTFRVQGEPINTGDRLVSLSDAIALEVYLASTSVWWTDRSRANREEPGKGVADDDRAVELARRFVDSTLQPALELTEVVVGQQTAAVSRSPEEEPRSERVAVTVTLRPLLGKLSVFGPGAKTRLAFTDSETPSDVAHFSRPVEPDGEVDVVHPWQVLERLTGDLRFAGVLQAGLRLHVRRLQLGYYSAPPNMFQRYLVPVYLVEGEVEGSDLDADIFRLYLPAVDIDARAMKEMGVRANPTVHSSFTSF